MTKLRTLVIVGIVVGVAAFPSGAEAKTTISLSGSTSITPLVTKLAKAYVKGPGRGKVRFKIFRGGSDVGVNDVSRGRVTLGMSSRDPKPSDPGGIVFNRLARDALCVATNRANGIRNLSTGQVQTIFSGRVRNWRDVGGAGVSGTINLTVRNAASGSQDAFQQIFMGPDLRVAGSAAQKSSNGLVQQTIKRSKTAIGYLSFDFVRGVHPVAYQGVACSLRNAKSGQYGGTRNFWLVSRGTLSGAAKKFLSWARKSRTGRRIVASSWVVA